MRAEPAGRRGYPLEPHLLRADWPAPAGVVAFTTLRGDAGVGASSPPFAHLNLGAHCGDEPRHVAANREALHRGAGLPAEPRWLRQVHGTRVLRFEAADRSREAPEADAAVTSAPGVVLAVLHADCLPLLLCARDGSEVGAVHAGWRGLAAGVVEAAVGAMRTPAADLLAWLGPAAGPQAYEVGEEVHAAFLAHDRRAATAFRATRAGHWHVDLYALARQRLAAAGVEQAWGGGWCTIGDATRFHSHRRDRRGGRMASLVWRAP